MVGVKRAHSLKQLYGLMIVPNTLICVDLGSYRMNMNFDLFEQNYDETEHTVEMPNEKKCE